MIIMLTTIYSLFFFISGTIFGSFYNVVGYRVPQKKSIVFPPSHCTSCNNRLKTLELIPIFSYLFLGGKCKNCKSEVSIMYPFMELFTGLLFFLSYLVFGLSLELIISLLFVSLSTIVIVSDLRYMIIPNEIIIIFYILILGSRLILNGTYDITNVILDSLLPFLFLYFIKIFGDKLFKKETLGGGDVKLMLIIGLLLGWGNGIISIFIGTFIAFPIAIYYYFKDKEHMLPFGPYLCIGALLIHYIGMSSIEIIRLFY